MAASQFTSRDKEEVYRLISLLNSSLKFLVAQLQHLSSVKILNRKYLKEVEGITQEVQTEIDAVLKK